MKIDIVSVFPEYFDVLGLSLFGKAQAKGLVEVHAHNLRDWTHDVHHSVDDTPVGGGAGMVMKPVVWSECLDDLLGLEPATVGSAAADAEDTAEVVNRGATENDAHAATATEVSNKVETGEAAAIGTAATDAGACANGDATTSPAAQTEDGVDGDEPGNATAADVPAEPAEPPADRPVLIFPNPSAPLFTQRDATELSRAKHLLFGCGRYEGYDARIPEYYRAQGVDVREYSIGDYVLNGGEVAVSVMLEAITRLLPGFMGNPESIVEESYTGEGALLEHRQYTKPAEWRGIRVPDVLLSGDHGKVDRFRRDEALERTDAIRPDLIAALDCAKLSKQDRKTLMALGWEVSGAHPRKLDR
ncbi:tRNA (guanosine(37)-N1)-methyltransferase TrmD [Bifidobacterium avesanii]|uniref:tRNA (guanine-N(1)-)-methyltransferase n=1 Tax=Bifidobacterium avesanii TaxID=1798157 RepID=A0A7K3TFE6_9BIFI|nr:tRNA (guanosine(37)-N1)-methyltransferase TrmD [Bifidobacterium avesanii]KAB8294350.1 tRNA (guanine-N1)-methyltransferase [Bifidobacterium avesanii]NEG77815.1 tRNA (guanosine(37)-N1)-methyltransferase TrmD [Bifidobacterium avesanii]